MFLILVNFRLFEFSAAILEKGLFEIFTCYSVYTKTVTKDISVAWNVHHLLPSAQFPGEREDNWHSELCYFDRLFDIHLITYCREDLTTSTDNQSLAVRW